MVKSLVSVRVGAYLEMNNGRGATKKKTNEKLQFLYLFKVFLYFTIVKFVYKKSIKKIIVEIIIIIISTMIFYQLL